MHRKRSRISRASRSRFLAAANAYAIVALATALPSAARADGNHGGTPSVPLEPEEDLRTYELEDTLEVRGRIDDLIGVATTSSEGRIGRRDFELRALLREGELLETVPGLIQTQHSGDGKGNQMFLRGFNLDHGTDFRTEIEGMPLNLPTHGHGQGYTDMNFLIPEMVETIEYRKGVFHPEIGDFGSAGGASVNLRRSVARPFFTFEIGADRYRRALGTVSEPMGAGQGLFALEVKGYDGPWELPQDLKKVSGLARLTHGWAGGTLSLLAMAYDNQWTASDQIPERAVRDGSIGRYGQVDSTLGGESSRYSLSANWSRARAGRSLSANVYLVQYELDLFSNFTYLLADPIHGDQLEQVDDRTVLGGGARFRRGVQAFSREHQVELGLDTRHDFIDEVALYQTEKRERREAVRKDEVLESSGGVFAALHSRWHPRFRSELGARVDAYYFDVSDELIDANSGTESAAIASPKASLVFSPTDRSEVYLSGGFGFHSNDARGTTITVDPATMEPAEAVDPLVRSRGAETGVRLSPIEGLRSTLSVWWLELDSELVYVGDGGGTEPSDKSRRIGVEWANFYQVVPEVAVDLDLSVTRARLIDVAEDEDHIPGALESVLAAGVTWRQPGRWFGSIRLRHLGEYSLIEDDSVRAEATTLVNASVGRALGRVRIAASVLNAFDEEASDIQYFYESRLPGEPPEGVAGLHFHPVEPRQVRIGVGVGL